MRDIIMPRYLHQTRYKIRRLEIVLAYITKVDQDSSSEKKRREVTNILLQLLWFPNLLVPPPHSRVEVSDPSHCQDPLRSAFTPSVQLVRKWYK